MIQVDIPFAAAMGSSAAGAARVQLRAGGREEYLRTWLATNLFLIFGFSWIPVVFLLNYFGWETTHMWWTASDVTAYPWFVPIVIIVSFACGNAGFLLGARLETTGRAAANRVFYIAIFACGIAWMIGFYPRTLKLGSYHTWTTSPWVYEDPAFVRTWMIAMSAWVGLYFVLLAHLLRRGRSFASHPGHRVGAGTGAAR
jgi:hypothetical protein